MKRTFFVFVLAAAMAVGALAAPQLTPGSRPNEPEYILSASKPSYGPGEPVEFVLRQRGRPVTIPGAVYMIQLRQPNGQWRDVFRGPAEPPAESRPSIMRPAGLFVWNRVDNAGNPAPAGSYQALIFRTGQTNDTAFAGAAFTLTGVGGFGTQPPAGQLSQGPLVIDMRDDTLDVGEPAVFILRNAAGGPLDLTNARYDLQRFEKGRWDNFFSSIAGHFDIATLAPGAEYKFTRRMRDRSDKEQAGPGRWRIIFFTPSLGQPAVKEFTIARGRR